MKVLRCEDAGYDCQFVAGCESAEVCIRLCSTHAQREHSVQVTPQLQSQWQKLIKEI